jgi:hypothetical protein
MTTSSNPSPRTIDWQPERHLRSGDHFWIITDIQVFTSSYFAWSPPQQLFKVGIYDLTTERIGLATFGRDIAYAILKAGITPPPWSSPAPFGIALTREGHDRGAKGRYVTTAAVVPLDPGLMRIVPEARKRIATQHYPNAVPGVWSDLVFRAAREKAIESAALGMVGLFSVGDIKKIVGKDVDVTPVIQRLAEEGKLLPPIGKKRGTRYEVTPLLVTRPDRTG